MHMPRLDDSMASQSINGSSYDFSATKITSLGASEYTIGTVVMDVSGSTSTFRDGQEKALKAIVEACRRNPRADNMMLRVVKFDHRVTEVHGFKPLSDCNESDYDGCLGRGGGSTALYDACYTAVQAMTQYGQDLVDNDYDVNGIVFVCTDGFEYPSNNSTATKKMVADALGQAVTGEVLESVVSILLGIDTNSSINATLEAFKTEAGFTQYVNTGDATAAALAKLGDFVSRSISSQSQALGTGGPSQSLSF